MLDGEGEKNGQTIIGHRLVLYRASHDDIVVAVAPVGGYAFHETVDTFGEEVEPEVAPLPHHLPAFRPPFVRVFQQKVGSEAGEDQLAALYLPRLVALLFHRQVEIGCLATFAARALAAIHLVLPVDIAVLAPGAYLGTSVPRIPIGIYLPALGHDWAICLFAELPNRIPIFEFLRISLQLIDYLFQRIEINEIHFLAVGLKHGFGFGVEFRFRHL